ncbi:MAG: ABC transporter substrate-binding protein, partial [Verrucomicrobiota bacterium]
MKYLPLILSVLALGFTGCAEKKAASNQITVQLDWFPEPEHGGLFQAQAKGWFAEAGLDVKLVPGGPNAFVTQKVATNQAQIGQADSTNTLLAVNQGLPLLQVAAVFQNEPSVLMLHADNPITDFKQLDGKKIMARPDWAFLPYLKNKYGIDFSLIPFNFSVTNFIADPDFIQQGYYIAEPHFITQGGAKPPKFLYSWDAGFDAYSVLATNADWAKANPYLLRTFIAVYIRGWRDYLEHDPTPAHELMKAMNDKNTDAFLAFCRGMIISEKLVVGRDRTDTSQIGRLDPARYQTQITQLEDLDILPKGKLTVD